VKATVQRLRAARVRTILSQFVGHHFAVGHRSPAQAAHAPLEMCGRLARPSPSVAENQRGPPVWSFVTLREVGFSPALHIARLAD
jgi:hypothetical protein